MAQIIFNLPADRAAAFTEAAAARGGKSALLRELVELYLGALDGPPEPVPPRIGPLGSKVSIRLDREEMAALDEAADEQGMTRHAWAARSLRSRLRQAPQFNSDESRALALIAGDLRRIGTNVNQIARALNVAVLAGEVLNLEMAAVEDAHRDIMELASAVRSIRRAKVIYWSGADGGV